MNLADRRPHVFAAATLSMAGVLCSPGRAAAQQGTATDGTSPPSAAPVAVPGEPSATTSNADAPTSSAPPSTATPPTAVDPRVTPAKDDVRFRGAIQLDVGAFTYPAAGVALGLAGLSGQLGAQFNDEFGVVFVPGLDILFGELGGVSLSSAVLFDYTLDSTWAFGIGPDVGVFGAIGGDATSATAAGGVNYGARLRAAWFPALSRGGDTVRRKAFAVGLDVRLLGGPAGAASASGAGTSATGAFNAFVLSPTLTVGYQAF